ncbi:hypothetical protein EJ04DRAFT_534376 [Polyplosphaeria fusca]|uniref:Trafficking protein particle complex II-specific subunit 65 IgD3 domain-containing protein n=1 Tax=Polyplosphaeria fusca TaxID=682080 RepID=A0A9P4V3I6_9PLEO|nr:hypothetical protein EJ04DRAFT_534376 [Polyplosphaeria fusca]
MASEVIEAPPRGSAEFVEGSVLEAVVPSDSFLNVEHGLKAWDGRVEDENSSILPSIAPRQLLLFDEIAPVYVVLRTPLLQEVSLKSYLSRLAITLEAFVFGSAPSPEPEAKAPPPKELIYSETIKDSNEPLVLRHEQDSSHVYVIWSVDVFIGRPRGRFHKPLIYFHPTASLKPPERVKKSVIDDEYLPSKVPTALNLLQPFENDPALAGTHPRLSSLRISKIAPTAPLARELVRPIHTGQRRLFRALPALIWRIRYSKVPASLSDASLIASLDLEVAHVTGYNITIDDVKISMRGGTVKSIAGHEESSRIYKPADQMTYLYKLTPDLAADGTPKYGADGHILNLKIGAKVLISEQCRPKISIEWKTAVDFSVDHNENLVRAAHRLSNPSAHAPLKADNPDSLPSHDTNIKEEDDGNKVINVTLTLSGPAQVHVGEPFRWDAFVVNRSDKTRKLAILALPKRKRDLDRHKAHPSTSSIGARTDSKDLLAHAVVDENVVYAKQKQARTEPADLVCLTTDVRIGHLAPGACYTADLRFLALSPGVLQVDAVRIVDLATNEVSDIRDLPSIDVTSSARMIENTRRRLLYQLNSRWIYGKIPLLHAAVFILQMAAVSLLTRKFNTYYSHRPGTMSGIASQSLTAIRQRGNRKSASGKDDFLSIEIHDLDKKDSLPAGELIPDSKHLPPPFDFERLTRFMAYGFLMAPVQHKWFGFLSRTFPVTKDSAMVPALKRVAFDQFLFAPLGLACFFTFMTIAEGGGKRAVTRKFQDVYVPALKANFMVWPAVQILNFRVMPIQFQIPFVSTVGIAWTAYLSLTNSSDD